MAGNSGWIEVAQATVSIIPNMKGSRQKIAEDLGASVEPEGKSAGLKLGSGIMSAVKKILAGAAIGKVIKDSISAGADLQQSIGGVETLFNQSLSFEQYADSISKSTEEIKKFQEANGLAVTGIVGDDTLSAIKKSYDSLDEMSKSSAQIVKDNASNAWKTAGMSANEYMENVTSFSAALINSLDGDTVKAAQYADMAITDMADNANKFGTDIGSIANAYQGFAKSNYTMLDNLKLGYSGTKEGAKSLIEDAMKLDETFVASRDSSGNLTLSYADMVDAIHIVQENMGVTGTTAKEASQTFTGSLNSMKSAFTDLIGNMAIGEDITDELANVTESVKVFLVDNLLPMIGDVVGQIPTVIAALPGAIADILPELIPAAADIISSLTQGIVENIPVFIEGVAELGASAVNSLLSIDWRGAGLNLIEMIANGFSSLSQMAADLWQSVLNAFSVPIDLQPLSDLCNEAWSGITELAASIWNGVCSVFSGDISITDVTEIARNAWNGITDVASNVWESVKNVFNVEITFSDLSDAAETAWSGLSSVAINVWEGVESVFSSIEIDWPDFGEMAAGAFESIKNAASSVWDWVSNLFSGNNETVEISTVTGSTDEIEKALKDINLEIGAVDTSSVQKANEFVKQTVLSWNRIFTNLKLKIPDIGTETVSKASRIVATAVSNMKNAMSFDWRLPDLHGKLPIISASMQTAASSDGKSTVSYPSLNLSGYRWFDTGGIFTRPEIIGVSERRPEGVIPLDELWKNMDSTFEKYLGSNSQNITINSYVDGSKDPEQYAQELIHILKTELRAVYG